MRILPSWYIVWEIISYAFCFSALLLQSPITSTLFYCRSDFEHEARILTSLNDSNLVRVLGVCFKGEPACMVCEYTEEGDLYQFLQDHVAETSLSKSPGVPTLRYTLLSWI